MSTIDRSHRDAGGEVMTLSFTLSDPQRQFLEAEVARGGHVDASEYLLSLIEKNRERAEIHEFHESLRQAIEGPGTVMTHEEWDEIEREAHRQLAENERP